MDGMYRTLLFAKERGRDVRVAGLGASGLSVMAPEYVDLVFLHNDIVDEAAGGIRFVGRSGWIRRWNDGRVQACVPDGERLEAFGVCFEGRGPWSYNIDNSGHVELLGGAPRVVSTSVCG